MSYNYYNHDDEYTEKVIRHVEKLYDREILTIDVTLSDGSWDTMSVEDFMHIKYTMIGKTIEYEGYDAHVGIPSGEEIIKNNHEIYSGTMEVTDALKYDNMHEHEVDLIIKFRDDTILTYDGYNKSWFYSQNVSHDKDLTDQTIKKITKIYRAFKWCGYEKMDMLEIHCNKPIVKKTKNKHKKTILIYKKKE